MGLINDAAKLKPASSKCGRNAWWQQMRDDDPDQYKDMVKFIQNWQERGNVFNVFPTRKSMFRWLAGIDLERPREALITCSESSWMRFCEIVERGEQ